MPRKKTAKRSQTQRTKVAIFFAKRRTLNVTSLARYTHSYTRMSSSLCGVSIETP